jgi:hypothetical protein
LTSSYHSAGTIVSTTGISRSTPSTRSHRRSVQIGAGKKTSGRILFTLETRTHDSRTLVSLVFCRQEDDAGPQLSQGESERRNARSPRADVLDHDHGNGARNDLWFERKHHPHRHGRHFRQQYAGRHGGLRCQRRPGRYGNAQWVGQHGNSLLRLHSLCAARCRRRQRHRKLRRRQQ